MINAKFFRNFDRNAMKNLVWCPRMTQILDSNNTTRQNFLQSQHINFYGHTPTLFTPSYWLLTLGLSYFASHFTLHTLVLMTRKLRTYSTYIYMVKLKSVNSPTLNFPARSFIAFHER